MITVDRRNLPCLRGLGLGIEGNLQTVSLAVRQHGTFAHCEQIQGKDILLTDLQVSRQLVVDAHTGIFLGPGGGQSGGQQAANQCTEAPCRGHIHTLMVDEGQSLCLVAVHKGLEAGILAKGFDGLVEDPIVACGIIHGRCSRNRGLGNRGLGNSSDHGSGCDRGNLGALLLKRNSAQTVAAVHGHGEGHQYPVIGLSLSRNSLGCFKLNNNTAISRSCQVICQRKVDLCFGMQRVHCGILPLLDRTAGTGNGGLIAAEGNRNAVHGGSIVSTVEVHAQLVGLPRGQVRRQFVEHSMTNRIAPVFCHRGGQNSVGDGTVGGQRVVALMVHDLNGTGGITGHQALGRAQSRVLVKVPRITLGVIQCAVLRADGQNTGRQIGQQHSHNKEQAQKSFQFHSSFPPYLCSKISISSR